MPLHRTEYRMKTITDHRHRFDRIVRRALLAGIALTAAGTASAQVVPPPVVPTLPTTTPMVQPVPAPLPLPTLSPAQESELARLLAHDAVAQGLKDREPQLTNLTGTALVQAALDHAHAVRAGRLDTSDFQKDWAMRPQGFDPLPSFRDAVAKDKLAAWVASLPPPYAGYDTLVAGLSRYRKIQADGGWSTIGAGSELRMGGKGPQVAALRKRLAVEDSGGRTRGDGTGQCRSGLGRGGGDDHRAGDRAPGIAPGRQDDVRAEARRTRRCRASWRPSPFQIGSSK